MVLSDVNNIFLVLLLLGSLASGQILSPEEISVIIKRQESEPASQESMLVWQEAKAISEQLEETKKQVVDFQAKAGSAGKVQEIELPPTLADDAALGELTARLTEISALLEASRNRVLQDTSELKGSADRISELSKVIAETRDLIADIVVAVEGGSALEHAQREKSILGKALLEARVESFQAEQVFLQLELDKLPERIGLRKEYNGKLLKQKEELQLKVASLRGQQAQSTDLALKQSSEELLGIEALAAVLEEIRVLNEERTGEAGLLAKIKAEADYEKEITELNRKIESQAFNAKEKIDLLESVGLGIDTDAGIVLREQRAKLPRTIDLQKRLRNKVEMSIRSEVEVIELLNKQANHPPLKSEAVERLLEENPKLKRAEVTALFEQRRILLENLISEHKNLRSTLALANGKAQLTIEAIESYSTYLDKRLLWSRSTGPITLSEPRRELSNIREFFEAEMRGKAWASIEENWFSRFLPALALTTVFFFGIFRRRRLSEYEEQGSEQAARRNCTSIRPTVETIVSSVLIAGTFPAIFFVLALLISEPAAYRMGCLNAGVFLFVSSLIYRFSRPATLFESHFKFSEVKAQRIRKTLRLFIPIMLPFVFGIGALCVSGGVGSSGRIVFMIAMLIVATLAHQLFHPKHSIVGNPEKATLLSRVSYVVALGLPLSFATGAALGFFSSVLTLRGQVLATAGVLLGAFLVTRFFTRWILVSRRRLAIKQALQRREATLAHRKREESGEHESESDMPSLEEVKAQAVDIVEVEEQTTQLVKFGVYFSVLFTIFSIWSSSLTALSVLDQMPLFPGATAPTAKELKEVKPDGALSALAPQASSGFEIEGAEQLQDSVSELVLPPSDDFVSWQDLLLSLFVFLLTFVAARNIPGLLSLVVFSRLKLGPGGNFAFTTIARYFIVFSGVVIGLNKVGITWDKVQWLAAAITLGIGFGLQEIFANFVSGLILLFERPLRLGDIVTVGDVSGKVSEIKIRATTIRQFNNRDLIVPNKDFITNQLTNWTLRDSILRFELAVGIAYGSDTRQAEEILKRIVNEHPHVLAEPGPAVIFNSFGASSLDFLIRAHVGQAGNLVDTQSELHFQIDDAFREAGIEIAFPQQDIHLRSLPDGVTLSPLGSK